MYRMESIYRCTMQKKDENGVVKGRTEVTEWQIPAGEGGSLTLENGCEK